MKKVTPPMLGVIILLLFWSCGLQPPIARAGEDITIEPGETVCLDGRGSQSLEALSLKFFWKITAIPEHSAASLKNPLTSTPSFTADLEGTYTVELTVEDNAGRSAPDSVNITVARNLPTCTLTLDIRYENGSNGWIHLSPPGVNIFPSNAGTFTYYTGAVISLEPMTQPPIDCETCPIPVFSHFEGSPMSGNSIYMNEDKNITAVFTVTNP